MATHSTSRMEVKSTERESSEDARRRESTVTPTPSATQADTGPRQHGLQALELAEGGLLADVGVVLDLAAIYLPLVGPLLTPMVPTPFAILMLRRGPRTTLLAGVVAGFLVSVLAGPHFGWRMALQAGIGLLLGWAMRRRIRWPVVLALGTVTLATVTLVSALLAVVVTGLPVADLVQALRNGINSFAFLCASAAQLLGLHAQWLALWPGYLAAAALALRWWPLLLYVYILVGALPMVGLYFSVATGAARVLGHEVAPFPPAWSVRLVRWAWRLLLLPARLLARGLRAPGAAASRLRMRIVAVVRGQQTLPEEL
jgi:hypothetical protein